MKCWKTEPCKWGWSEKWVAMLARSVHLPQPWGEPVPSFLNNLFTISRSSCLLMKNTRTSTGRSPALFSCFSCSSPMLNLSIDFCLLCEASCCDWMGLMDTPIIGVHNPLKPFKCKLLFFFLKIPQLLSYFNPMFCRRNICFLPHPFQVILTPSSKSAFNTLTIKQHCATLKWPVSVLQSDQRPILKIVFFRGALKCFQVFFFFSDWTLMEQWNFLAFAICQCRITHLHFKPAKDPVDWWWFGVVWFIYSWMLVPDGRSVCTKCLRRYKWATQTNWGLMWNILRVKNLYSCFFNTNLCLVSSQHERFVSNCKKKYLPDRL